MSGLYLLWVSPYSKIATIFWVLCVSVCRHVTHFERSCGIYLLFAINTRRISTSGGDLVWLVCAAALIKRSHGISTKLLVFSPAVWWVKRFKPSTIDLPSKPSHSLPIRSHTHTTELQYILLGFEEIDQHQVVHNWEMKHKNTCLSFVFLVVFVWGGGVSTNSPINLDVGNSHTCILLF